MQGEVEGLWGPSKAEGGNAAPSLGFEDSFTPTTTTTSTSTTTTTTNRNDQYVPLQDSPQYLAGLEGKLARIRGRSDSSRKSESRRLLDALAGTRSCHAAQLMQDGARCPEQAEAMDQTPPSLASTIDPQGALGAMLRRVAPDKVALTPEELCHLLQADLLAQVHETLGEAPDGTRATQGQGTGPTQTSGMPDVREPSSDEGEK